MKIIGSMQTKPSGASARMSCPICAGSTPASPAPMASSTPAPSIIASPAPLANAQRPRSFASSMNSSSTAISPAPLAKPSPNALIMPAIVLAGAVLPARAAPLTTAGVMPSAPKIFPVNFPLVGALAIAVVAACAMPIAFAWLSVRPFASCSRTVGEYSARPKESAVPMVGLPVRPVMTVAIA